MLVLSVTKGDATTITTPNGEIITIRLLGQDDVYKNYRIGIDAPSQYQILRHNLRDRLCQELSEIPTYEISSAHHCSELVSAYSPQQALDYYQQRYPSSHGLKANWIEHTKRHPFYRLLEQRWLSGVGIPFGVQMEPPTRQTGLHRNHRT